MELLAPANTSTFFESINNGADAIYFGLDEFSARASAENFSLENLSYYVSYAHLFGVKVYCTVNTLIKNTELNKFFNLIVNAYNVGVDAFILQDVFLGKVLHETYPEIELHLSTQAGVNNLHGALLAKECGFKRVILARETQKEEIKEIASIIETEIFVHGALCSSYSGHCYYSSYIGGNSGNRGRCKQPCRQKFTYLDNKKINLGKYNLSLSDLMLCDYIQEIKDLGVKSVKIEGRMRSEEYCACVVSLYRKAIDSQDYSIEKENLRRIYNRGDYTSGYFVKDGNVISDKIQSHKGVFFDKITNIDKNALFCSKKANNGDCFKIIRNGYEVGNCLYENNKFLYKGKIERGDSLYITKDSILVKNLLGKRKLKDIVIELKVVENYIIATYNNVEYKSENIVQQAIKKPTTNEEILENFKRVDNYPFNVSLSIVNDKNIFVPKSLLNDFRRIVYNKIFSNNSNVKNLKIKDIIRDNIAFSNNKHTICMVDNFSILPSADKYVLYPNNYKILNKYVEEINSKNIKNVYIFIPSFLSNKDFALIEPYVSCFAGVYADGLNGVFFAKSKHLSLIAGLGLNIFNSISYNSLKDYVNCDDIIISKEIASNEVFAGKTLNFGRVSLMEFIYCPFRNNCDKCSKENFFKCYDEYEDFILRRVEISSCRFELLTNKVIKKLDKFANFISLICFSEEEKINFVNGNYSIFKTYINKEVK